MTAADQYDGRMAAPNLRRRRNENDNVVKMGITVALLFWIVAIIYVIIKGFSYYDELGVVTALSTNFPLSAAHHRRSSSSSSMITIPLQQSNPNPTSAKRYVKNQWPLVIPKNYGSVNIPGTSVTAPINNYDDNNVYDYDYDTDIRLQSDDQQPAYKIRGNVKNQWPLVVPGNLGRVEIPGTLIQEKEVHYIENSYSDDERNLFTDDFYDEIDDEIDYDFEDNNDDSFQFFALPSTFTTTRNPFSIDEDDYYGGNDDGEEAEGGGGGFSYSYDNYVERNNNNNRGRSLSLASRSAAFVGGSSSSSSSNFHSSFSRFQSPALSMANNYGGQNAGGTPAFPSPPPPPPPGNQGPPGSGGGPGQGGGYNPFNNNNPRGRGEEGARGGDEFYDENGSDNNTNDNNRYQPGPPGRGRGPPPGGSFPGGGNSPGPSASGPRGTNRFNTVGGVGKVSGSNLSRDGHSMQDQNKRDSNTVGRGQEDRGGGYDPFNNNINANTNTPRGGRGDEYFDDNSPPDNRYPPGPGRGASLGNDRFQPPSPPGPPAGPRGTNRFNTVGSVGKVSGANLSRDGHSMQDQNRKDSNVAGRGGRMDDFAPDSTNTNFPPNRNNNNPSNDLYSKGGYQQQQDSPRGGWKDNGRNKLGEQPPGQGFVPPSYTPSYSRDNRFEEDFDDFGKGDGGGFSYAGGRQGRDTASPGAGNFGSTGNFPYDMGTLQPDDDYDERSTNNNDFYSRNGNVVDNRSSRQRLGSGSGGGGTAPGRNQNYYDVGGGGDSDRRMDRGGGLMRYTPNNPVVNNNQGRSRGGGGVDGYNSYNVNANAYGGRGGGYDSNDGDFYDDDVHRNGDDYSNDYDGGGGDEYDSSDSFYNNEGKRVRRYDSNWDRPESFYNPDQLSNDDNDPTRQIQNKRRRAGRDVSNGTPLRRYDPEWDAGGGLYDEDALYGGGVKRSRNFTPGYGGGGGSGTGGSSVGGGVNQSSRRGSPRSRLPEPIQYSRNKPAPIPGRRPPQQDRRYGGGDPYDDDGYGDRDRDDRGREQYQPGGFDEGDAYGMDDTDYRRQDDGYSYDDGHGGGDDDYGPPRRRKGLIGRRSRDDDDDRFEYYSPQSHGPELRGDDTMERFRQGKDVQKKDLYNMDTSSTASNQKKIKSRTSMSRSRNNNENGRRSSSNNSNSNRGNTDYTTNNDQTQRSSQPPGRRQQDRDEGPSQRQPRGPSSSSSRRGGGGGGGRDAPDTNRRSGVPSRSSSQSPGGGSRPSTYTGGNNGLNNRNSSNNKRNNQNNNNSGDRNLSLDDLNEYKML